MYVFQAQVSPDLVDLDPMYCLGGSISTKSQLFAHSQVLVRLAADGNSILAQSNYQRRRFPLFRAGKTLVRASL